MRTIFLILAVLAAIPFCSSALATTDLSTLGSPDVSISSNSGPPGSSITITISHIPDISKTSYPYPDLYIYIPFSQPFGTTISSHCGGEDCFPIYTHDNAINHDFADRTVTFSLPSTNNPKPVVLNSFENTVCDIITNGKTVERFSTLCNTKNEPPGLYQIKLGWVLETDLDQKYTVKTIPFLVTPGIAQPSNPVADNGDTILKEYQNGTISQAQFYAKLKSRDWTDEQIRQALAVIGKLPHQMGILGPDYKLLINQTNSMANSVNTTQKNTTISEIPQSETKQHINTTTTKEQDRISFPVQQNASIKSIQNNSTYHLPLQNDFIWNNIIIGLSISAAAIMAGVVIFVKIYRNKEST